PAAPESLLLQDVRLYIEAEGAGPLSKRLNLKHQELKRKVPPLEVIEAFYEHRITDMNGQLSRLQAEANDAREANGELVLQIENLKANAAIRHEHRKSSDNASDEETKVAPSGDSWVGEAPPLPTLKIDKFVNLNDPPPAPVVIQAVPEHQAAEDQYQAARRHAQKLESERIERERIARGGVAPADLVIPHWTSGHKANKPDGPSALLERP